MQPLKPCQLVLYTLSYEPVPYSKYHYSMLQWIKMQLKSWFEIYTLVLSPPVLHPKYLQAEFPHWYVDCLNCENSSASSLKYLTHSLIYHSLMQSATKFCKCAARMIYFYQQYLWQLFHLLQCSRQAQKKKKKCQFLQKVTLNRNRILRWKE